MIFVCFSWSTFHTILQSYDIFILSSKLSSSFSLLLSCFFSLYILLFFFPFFYFFFCFFCLFLECIVASLPVYFSFTCFLSFHASIYIFFYTPSVRISFVTFTFYSFPISLIFHPPLFYLLLLLLHLLLLLLLCLVFFLISLGADVHARPCAHTRTY